MAGPLFNAGPEDIIHSEVLLVSLLKALGLGGESPITRLDVHQVHLQVGPLLCTAAWDSQVGVWRTSTAINPVPMWARLGLIEPARIQLRQGAPPKSAVCACAHSVCQCRCAAQPPFSLGVTGPHTTSTFIDRGQATSAFGPSSPVAVIKLCIQNIPLTAFSTKLVSNSSTPGQPCSAESVCIQRASSSLAISSTHGYVGEATPMPACMSASMPLAKPGATSLLGSMQHQDSTSWNFRAHVQGETLPCKVVGNMAFVVEKPIPVSVLVLDLCVDLTYLWRTDEGQSHDHGFTTTEGQCRPMASRGYVQATSAPVDLTIELMLAHATLATLRVPVVVHPFPATTPTSLDSTDTVPVPVPAMPAVPVVPAKQQLHNQSEIQPYFLDSMTSATPSGAAINTRALLVTKQLTWSMKTSEDLAMQASKAYSPCTQGDVSTSGGSVAALSGASTHGAFRQQQQQLQGHKGVVVMSGASNAAAAAPCRVADVPVGDDGTDDADDDDGDGDADADSHQGADDAADDAADAAADDDADDDDDVVVRSLTHDPDCVLFVTAASLNELSQSEDSPAASELKEASRAKSTT